MQPLEIQHFDCACFSCEHTMRLVYDPDDGDLWAEIHLAQSRPWWRRMWPALRHVFGYRSKYGNWDCLLFRPEEAGRLTAVLEAWRQRHGLPVE